MESLKGLFLSIFPSIVSKIHSICTILVHGAMSVIKGIKKDGLNKPSFLNTLKELAAVIHAEFNRMRCHAHLSHFFHLKIDVTIDPVIGKYTTTC
jgi:hypothetical protein